jgi:CHAT domain-containing protein/tetratricopeptide (TPR) repeat protein
MPGKDHDQKVLQEIYTELNHLSDLSQIPRRIELCGQALAIISKEKESELWATLQDDLASNLVQTTMGARAENIEQAIAHYQQALEVRNNQGYSEKWASTTNNLATAYRDRIRGERAENIEKAIEYYQEALKVRTHESFPNEWAMTLGNLAVAYYKRIHGKRAENLEYAICYFHQALKVYTRRNLSHYWVQAKNSLGEVYRVRICGSRMKNIERAIYHFKQILEVASQEELAMVQNSLGNAYLARICGDLADNIEQSIYYYKQALKVRTRQADPERWAMTQYNLGNAYRNRIRGDQTENIEQSIQHLEQSLKVRTRRALPEDWAQTQNNLGNAYLARIRGERTKNIERAIIHYRQSLKVRTGLTLPEDWAQSQNNLGNAYLGRIGGKRSDNIEEAVRCYKQALKVRTREAFPQDWAQTLNNLAGAERTRTAENIEQVIRRLQQSLEVYTREALPQEWAGTQNNLAIAYTGRTLGERAENIEQAIQHYQQALEVYTQALPDNRLKTARALGNLAFEQQRWELARGAYKTAFDARDVLMQASISRTSKQTELGEAQNLPPRAAYAHVQLDDVKQAVEVLEKGRAQLLRESLERRWLEQLPALGFTNLYEDYKQAIELYDALQRNIGMSENISPADLMSQALEKIQAAIVAIREKAGQNHPQYCYFLKALTCDEIQKQAHEKLLVYLSATSAGGLALIVSEKGAQSIALPKLNQISLQKQIWSPSDEEIDRINDHLQKGYITLEDIKAVSGGYFSAYALWSLTPYLTNISGELMDKLFKAWQKSLDETTCWLWNVVMEELVTTLKNNNKSIILIPVGQLAFLPLHAAWTEDTSKPTHRRYALDDLNISYAPSAHALWQASLSAERPAENLMAVDNPDGTLSYAEDEVQAVLDVFKQSKHLLRGNATIKAVKEEMQNAEVLHFATHGNAGWQDEEQARLKLADGYLTLPNIFEIHLSQARLAVLSACETGVPSLKLIDEMIGLPAGMMQAGVPGVVGSLWSVSDMSTAMLMARFYSLWREEGRTPQEALHQAQIWLRDNTTEQKKDFFKLFIEGKLSGLSADVAKSFYTHLSLAEPNEVDFSLPYYWAAFTYTGV